MLKDISDLYIEDDIENEQPSKTFKLDFDNNTITGTIDGAKAIAQSINCMLNTERYAYLVYGFNYGICIDKYIGQSVDYIKCDLPKEIEDTLLQDDRILSVHSFFINQIGVDSLEILFTADTTEGEINIRKEV